MELTLINSILLIGIIIYLFISRKSFSQSSSSNQTDDKKTFYNFDDSFTDYEKKLIVKLYEKFNKYSNSKVGLDFILTTVWKESGGQVYKDIPNEKIIGDNGNSIGYFQIYKYGALIEVNNRELKQYKFEDLKDEQINVFFGISYLSYCIDSALRQQKNKPLAWLVAKKYNGGLDETETSLNARAEEYANDYYGKYLKIKKFFNLNFA